MKTFVVFVAICAFVACGGGSGTPTTPQQTCIAYPLPAPPPMIYPQNGATGVPDGNFTLILGFGYAQATSLTSASNTVGPLSPTSVPSPLPSGAATPSPIFTPPVAYSVPPLRPATTYMVSPDFHYPNECPVSIGSFTTR